MQARRDLGHVKKRMEVGTWLKCRKQVPARVQKDCILFAVEYCVCQGKAFGQLPRLITGIMLRARWQHGRAPGSGCQPSLMVSPADLPYKIFEFCEAKIEAQSDETPTLGSHPSTVFSHAS